jgi:hypothetical protein
VTTWTKEAAISYLETLISEVDPLKGQRRMTALHTEWLSKTMTFLEEVFGRDSMYYRSIAAIPWHRTGSMLLGGFSDPHGFDYHASIESQHQEAYREQLDGAKGILLGALDKLQRADEMDSVYEGKDTPIESSLIVRVINLAEFKLRKVVRNTPEAERDIQDSFENLLVGADIPYSREAEKIEYSSKTYIPDFVIGRIDLAIDMKLCGREGREKEIISEINDDILAYQTAHSNLLFVVYDVGFIRDVDRFVGSFQEHERVIVRVVKH